MSQEPETCPVCGVHMPNGTYCSDRCHDIDTGQARPVTLAEVLELER